LGELLHLPDMRRILHKGFGTRAPGDNTDVRAPICAGAGGEPSVLEREREEVAMREVPRGEMDVRLGGTLD
jgi:hypothetical protein